MKPKTLVVIASALAIPHELYAAGFQLQERSASGLGRAFSGEAAMGDDASVIASNPAGMLLLEDEWSFAIGASSISPDIEINGVYAPPAPAPVGTQLAARGKDVAPDAYVPFAYVSKRINDRVSVGFGSYTTYGLKTNYATSFTARSIADFSELLTVNLNPSIAWRLNEQWSIGVGFDALHAKGKLTATQPSTRPLLDLTGSDWGYGYNVGILYVPTEDTRFGLHYRSAIDLELEGRSVSVVPPFNGHATLSVELPDSLEFSAVHDIGNWSIHGDALWTNWSKFQQLAPQVTGAAVQPPITMENWKDSWRFSLGTTWRATDTWTFRAGVAYDKSPVPDANLTLRIPDADRLWLSFGASWEISPCWTLDLGYAHVFADDIYITDGDATTGVFRGEATGSADILSLGISTVF